MIRIFKTSLSSSSDSPEVLTTELGQQTSRGRRGFGPKSSGHRSPGGGASILANKRLTLPFLAFVVVLAAGLLFLMPGGLLQAQQSVTSVDYPENGKGSVITLSTRDPEDVAPTVWSLLTSHQADLSSDGNLTDIMVGATLKVGPDGVLTQMGGTALTEGDIRDHGDFKISQDGVLTFESPPSFESPNGGQYEVGDTGTPNENTPADGSNTYNVVVQSADRGDIIQRNWFRVIVNVTDLEETGKVTLSHLQPEIDVDIMASVSDPDGGETATTWKWFRSSSKSGPWEQIRDVTTGNFIAAATYNPEDEADEDDRNMYLRAEASYTDSRSAGKRGAVVSDHPVQPAHEDNSAPEFGQTVVDRSVLENTKAGTNIGAPVVARDPDSGDILQYTLGGNDAASFSIDKASGQLKTKASLDFDTDNEYTVTVTATDSSGLGTTGNPNPDPATVTISINNIDEAPKFSAGATKKDVNENATGTDLQVGTYTASDPEDGVVTLSLSGDDADKFELAADTDTGPAATQTLSFKEKQDFEARADSDGNNVYEVTVEASDGSNVGKRNVTVKVINLQERGKITFSGGQPLIGREITATITDEDGVVPETVVWSWHRLAATIATLADAAAEVPSAENAIPGATSATYTPVSADLDRHLKVQVTYADMTYDIIVTVPDAAVTTPVADSINAPATAKVGLDPVNKRPVFDDGASTDRYVVENTDADMDIAGVVNAKDPNGDALTYMLGGPDAASFDIESDSRGQLETKAELDHEAAKNRYTVTLTADDGRGQANSTATITVNIHVTDADEEPTISDRSVREATETQSVDYPENGKGSVITLSTRDPEDVAPTVWSLLTSHQADLSSDGNLTDIMVGATLKVGPDGVLTQMGGTALTEGDIRDHGDFKISQDGVLTFESPPSFESPNGGQYEVGDTGTPNENTPADGSNTYNVVVQSADRGDIIQRNWFRVIVNVTDLEETGKVTLSHLQPEIGIDIMASVSDPDGGETATTWKWFRSSSKSGPWEQIRDSSSPSTPKAFVTTATYNPQDEADEDDRNMYLRAEASYTDSRSAGKLAGDDSRQRGGISDHPVQSEHEDNSAPEFGQTVVDRSVLENTKAGTNIGAPVVARDPDSGDILQYTLGGNDAASFSIDKASGQLKTKASLDFDTDNEYTVTVTATDSSGLGTTGNPNPDPATVTISINNIDEAPKFSAGATKKDVNENATGTDLQVGTYTASDPENGVVTLSLSGDDADRFRLTGTTSGTRVLELTGKQDFEARADSDGNNVYEVTVEASDGSNVGKRNVTVKVINLQERGKITFSGGQPLIGREITATITDEDGVVPETVVWSWHRLDATDATAAADEAAADTNAIPGATSAAYTPKAADLDKYLKARVTYADMTYDIIVTVPDAAVTTPVADSINAPATAKVGLDPVNKRPVFDDGVSTDRYVVENTDGDMDIAGEVNAKDPNADALTYTLGGPDAASFDIESDTRGQLETKAELDHEAAKNRYTVTLTADDGRGQANSTATITVNIHVTDADEEPTLMMGGLRIFGLSTIEYLEEGIDAVATYTAEGPMADMATWTLEGADAGAFSLAADGMLTFSTSPDYEAHADADMDNIYRVTLRAADGTYMDTRDVTVTVVNVDEDGVVTFQRDGVDATNATILVGDMITAVLMDPDGGVSGEEWQWSKSMSMDDFIPIAEATGASYTPVEADDGYYLRATVMYTDGHGPYKEATTTTTGMVTTVPDQMGTVRLSSMSPVVGVALTAALTDPDGSVTGETWMWYKSMDSTFMDGTEMEIGDATSAYTPMADDEGYYLMVKVMYTDGHGVGKEAMATTTGMVTTVPDQMGTVRLSSMSPAVNVELTATLTDPDGSVTGETWMWYKSMDMTFMDGTEMEIGDATSAYTPMADDEGYYLMVKVMYADGHGAGKEAMATTTNKVVADADALLVARYDTNPSNGQIDKSEVIAAINDYLFGEGDAAISKADVIKLINLYLFG